MKEDETEAPYDIMHYWESGKAGNRAALSAMKPGVKGVDVDRAQRTLMEKAGSDSAQGGRKSDFLPRRSPRCNCILGTALIAI